MTALEEWARSVTLTEGGILPNPTVQLSALAKAILKDSTNVEEPCSCESDPEILTAIKEGCEELNKGTGIPLEEALADLTPGVQQLVESLKRQVNAADRKRLEAEAERDMLRRRVRKGDNGVAKLIGEKAELIQQLQELKQDRGEGAAARKDADVVQDRSVGSTVLQEPEPHEPPSPPKGGRMKRKELIKYLKDRESQWEKRRVEVEGGAAAATPYSITYAKASMHMCREIRMLLEAEHNEPT